MEINRQTFCIGIQGAYSKIGVLHNLSKFDSTFFNVHPKLTERLEPQIRVMLESTYEAFVDAGVFFCVYLFPDNNDFCSFIQNY